LRLRQAITHNHEAGIPEISLSNLMGPDDINPRLDQRLGTAIRVATSVPLQAVTLSLIYHAVYAVTHEGAGDGDGRIFREIFPESALRLHRIVTLPRTNAEVWPLGHAHSDPPEPAVRPLVRRVVSKQILCLKLSGNLMEHRF